MRALLLSAVTIVAILAVPAAASACSVAAQSNGERLARADRAIFGEIVSRRLVEDRPELGDSVYRYRFRVIEVYKGRMRRHTTLEAQTQSSLCGFGPAEVGARFGVLLHGKRAAWRIGFPDLISRAELRRLRKPRAPSG